MSTPAQPHPPAVARRSSGRLGLTLGALVAIVMLLLPPPAAMPAAAWRTAAIAALMAVWWVTEAIPVAATALLPLAIFPLLGIATLNASAAPYANPVIFLFLGGFLLAAALQRCGLHRRLALVLIAAVGTRPDRIVLGFMLAAATLSMWVSNTATVVMLLPLAAPVVELVGGADSRSDAPARPFELALLLGLAYAASLGGLGTLIGTPPNALLAGFLAETHGIRIGFGQWMLLGVPLVVVSIPLAWLLLTRIVFRVSHAPNPPAAESVRVALRTMGPVTRGELLVGMVSASAAAAWITQPFIARVLPGVSDAGIAIIAGLVLFMLPLDDGRPALDWRAAEQLPWGVLVLFGGGLSLAAAIQGTGLAAWIGSALAGLAALPLPLIVLLVAGLVLFLTELTSNTATAAAFLPLVASLAVGIGAHPLLLAVPTALAASCAFMMPVATPPNAIVFGGGRLTIAQMARAGFLLNLLMLALVAGVSYWLAVPLLG